MKADDPYRALREEYQAVAGDYDRRWRRYVEASLTATLRRVDVGDGARVLDVGCGTGQLLESIRRRAPCARLHGVDLSRAMLDRAHERLPGACLVQARAESLPWPDGSFDVVVSTSVFHFIRHPLAALREMQRVLRPGGRLTISDWCRDYMTCRLLDFWLGRFDAAHQKTYNARELTAMLSATGWLSPHVERYRLTPFWGFMTATAVASDDA